MPQPRSHRPSVPAPPSLPLATCGRLKTRERAPPVSLALHCIARRREDEACLRCPPIDPSSPNGCLTSCMQWHFLDAPIHGYQWYSYCTIGGFSLSPLAQIDRLGAGEVVESEGGQAVLHRWRCKADRGHGRPGDSRTRLARVRLERTTPCRPAFSSLCSLPPTPVCREYVLAV